MKNEQNNGQNSDLNFEWKPRGKFGKGVLTAKVNGHGRQTDGMDMTLISDRLGFMQTLRKKHPGIPFEEGLNTLEEIAAGILLGDDSGEKEKMSQGQRVAQLAKGAELFHFKKAAFATIEVEDGEGWRHKETHPVKSEEFKEWLMANFHQRYKMPATSPAVQDAVGALAGTARYHCPEIKVAIRLAEHKGAIYLDLADDQWRIIKITPHGWSIVTDCPVKFLRREGMLPLPTPVPGGRWDKMRKLFNASDTHWMMMQSWLIGAMNPGGPFPLLCVNGEQGSAKSTACKMLRMLIDPNDAMLRSPPKDERDLMIAASNSWVCGFDNLSDIPKWLSDALCRLATGASFSTRKLMTDNVEMLFAAKRPIILNGIEEDVRNGDLNNRSITVMLQPIPKGSRMTEREVWAKFDHAAPEALGALLDGVACALGKVADVKFADLPRMADFAQWAVAAAEGMRWNADKVITIYANIRADADASALEQSFMGQAVALLLDHMPDASWCGSTVKLLEDIEKLTDDRTKRRKEWPGTVAKVAAQLRRIAPILRANGIEVEWLERTEKNRPVRLSKIRQVMKKKDKSARSAAQVPESKRLNP